MVHFMGLGNKGSQRGFGGKDVAHYFSVNYDVRTQSVWSCAPLSLPTCAQTNNFMGFVDLC